MSDESERIDIRRWKEKAFYNFSRPREEYMLTALEY
jgi:hypothetical protein